MEQPTTIKRPPPRLRTYSVAEDVALDLLSGRVVTGSIDVPEGARVRSIHSDFQRMSFILVVEHESFDEVTQGMVIPYADTLAMTLQTVDSLKREAVRDFLTGILVSAVGSSADEGSKGIIAQTLSVLVSASVERTASAIQIGAAQRDKPDLPLPWFWVGERATNAKTGQPFIASVVHSGPLSMDQQAEMIWDSANQEGGASDAT